MRLFRHAGLEELAPYLIRGHPGVLKELDSGPGFAEASFRRNDNFDVQANAEGLQKMGVGSDQGKGSF